jgi:SAM-dependent methyltransferase
MIAPISVVARLSAVPRYGYFFRDWKRFKAAGGAAEVGDFWPCLYDRTATSGIDAHYFHQAIWAFRCILESHPSEHVDIGSEVNFVGLLTTITSVSFVDIRPLVLNIPNYRGLSGSVLALPFESASVLSLSSLHVIEHIGLGRYGDPVDPEGSAKAAREIVRVVAAGGRAYISVPIGRPRVQFNGQRVFTVDGVRRMFAGLDLVEMAIIDADGSFSDKVNLASVTVTESGVGGDCGLGMFIFEKVRAD